MQVVSPFVCLGVRCLFGSNYKKSTWENTDLHQAYTHMHRQVQEACDLLLIKNIFCKHIDCCYILPDLTVIFKVFFWLISNLLYIIQGQLQRREQLLWNHLLSHDIRHNYNYANPKRCLRHIWEISPFNVIRSWFRTTAAYPNNKATGARQLFSERVLWSGKAPPELLPSELYSSVSEVKDCTHLQPRWPTHSGIYCFALRWSLISTG